MAPILSPIAIILVTSSSFRDVSYFRWPPKPQRHTRSSFFDLKEGPTKEPDDSSDDELDLPVPHPVDHERNSRRPKSSSQPTSRSSSAHPSHHPSHTPYSAALPRPSPAISLRNLPHHDPLLAFRQDSVSTIAHPTTPSNTPFRKEEYERYLGFPVDFLANILAPKLELCQQRFELVVDDLCFLGHPMRRGNGAEGSWAVAGDDSFGLGGANYVKSSLSGGVDTGRGRSKGLRSIPGINHEGSLSASTTTSSLGTLPSSTSTPTNLEDVQETASVPTDGQPVPTPSHPTVNLPPTSEPPSKPSIRMTRPHADNSILPTSISTHSNNADVDVDGTPYINHFHVVIVVDQPDTSARGHGSLPNYKLSALYKEVVFKLTAALYDAQVSENWVAAQSRQLRLLKEKCEHLDKVPWESYLQQALSISPLARALKSVYESMLHYPFSATVKIASLPLYVQLPLPPPPVEMDWVWWEEAVREDQDQRYDLTIGASEQLNSFKLAPWKALLLLDEPASPPSSRRSSRVGSKATTEDHPSDWFDRWEKTSAGTGGRSRTASSYGAPGGLSMSAGTGGRGSRSGGGSSAGGGNGIWGMGSMTALHHQEDSSAHTRLTSSTQGDGRDESSELEGGLEEDSFPLFSMFLEAIKPSLSLAEIARLPQFVDLQVDLQRDLYPMAKILIWKRKAIVIYPVKPGTRNVYYPCTSQGKDLTQMKEDFEVAFPELSPLLSFLGQISAAPVPYAFINPNPKDSASKRLYYEALLWLRRKKMVIGAPVRVRLIARREVKEIAYRTQSNHPPNKEEEAGEEAPEIDAGLLFDEMEDTIIREPAESIGQEKAWIEVMCRDKDAHDAEIFRKIYPYFNGKTSVQEMCYREDLSRKEISHVLKVFGNDIVINIHP